MVLDQIFDMLNVGIVVLDRQFTIRYWNRWLAQCSDLPAETVVGRLLFDVFPNLDTPRFRRNCKAVFSFGSFSFFSQKLHSHLFPFKPVNMPGSGLEFMQQNCTLGPIYDDKRQINQLFISVEDVTEAVVYQNRLVELNRRDGLTGLFNRRYLNQRLAEEFDRCRRYRRPLSLIMLDIDHFKRVNDTYGHQAGDQVIKAVAGVMDESLRKIDLAARYGGEEFCCALPETPGEAACIVAERMRKHVERLHDSCDQLPGPVTISLGVSELSQEMDNHEELLRVADEALYRAKNNGRNQVCRGEP